MVQRALKIHKVIHKDATGFRERLGSDENELDEVEEEMAQPEQMITDNEDVMPVFGNIFELMNQNFPYEPDV